MGIQLLLFNESDCRRPAEGGIRPAGDWVLDEETRAIGRRHAAEARAILRARRAAVERQSRQQPGAQPAA